MQLQQLRYFDTVVGEKSMNKAAEKLFVSQPSLSKSIASLEKELGTRLFYRTSRGVELTDHGKKLHEYARVVLKQVELIYGLKSEEQVQVLTVSAYPCMINGVILSRFYQRLDRHAEISMKECRIEEAMDNVDHMISEFAIIQVKQVQKKEVEKALQKKNLEYHELAVDDICINVGPGSPHYGKKSIHIQELLGDMVIRMQDDYFSNLCYFLDIDDAKFVDIEKTMFVNDGQMMIQVLRNTEAFRVSMKLESQVMHDYGIDTIPLEGGEGNISIGWIQRKNTHISEYGLEFLREVQQYVDMHKSYN